VDAADLCWYNSAQAGVSVRPGLAGAVLRAVALCSITVQQQRSSEAGHPGRPAEGADQRARLALIAACLRGRGAVYRTRCRGLLNLSLLEAVLTRVLVNHSLSDLLTT